MSTFRKRIWQDRIYTFRHFYANIRFALIDLSFGLIGLFSNPYRVCRKFLQKRREAEIYAYGETPLATYEKIAKECQIDPSDIWFELGAGRGKGCFWLAEFVGCQVVGVEWVPQFVKAAQSIKTLFSHEKVKFLCSEIQQVDLSSATFIYLYGIWPDLKLSPGTRVLSISEPLPGHHPLHSFWVRFPWGRTRAYLGTVKE